MFSVRVVGDEDGVDKYRFCEVLFVGLLCFESRMMDIVVEDGVVWLECEFVLVWGLYGFMIFGEVVFGSGLCVDVIYLDKSDEEVSGEVVGEKI